MISLATDAALSGIEAEVDTLASRLMTVAQTTYVPADWYPQALVRGWERAVDLVLADSFLSDEEESHLTWFANKFDLSRQDLDANGAWTRAAMGSVLRHVLNGELPARPNVEGPWPFNLQKSEALVWVFNNVEYYEERTRRSYVGGYQGVSVRIMKGVYYRTGGFTGHQIETSTMEGIDCGVLGITTKHIYFAGARKGFRIPYANVVTFTPYSDGIGVCRDAATAKPQVFVTGDGWFVYNLARNLSGR